MLKFGIRGNPGGYTIIEVMIVLGISAALLMSALLVFVGKQGRTAFEISVHDVESEISQQLKEVSTGLALAPDKYSCTVTGTTVTVTDTPPASQGTNKPCITLGRAFEIHTNPGNKIDVYTVIGSRLKGGSSGTDIAQTLADAVPTTDPTLLKDTYDISNATIRSSKYATCPGCVTTDSSLVGYYADLTGAGASGGGTSLLSKGYNFADSDSDVKGCIEAIFSGGPCSTPTDITNWQVCLVSDYDSTQTAQVGVNSSSQGVTTAVKFVSC